jgi:hypothetical protein
MRTDIYAQFEVMGPWAVYLNLPFSTLSGAYADEILLQNAEIGAIYATEMGWPAKRLLSATTYVGLILPTAGSTTKDIVYNTISSMGRITDAALLMPDVLGFRVAGNLRFDSGVLFMQGDIGLDSLIDIVGDKDTILMLRANGAIGVNAGLVTVSGELVSTGTVSGTGSNVTFEERFQHTAGITVAGNFPMITPYIGAAFPLDQDPRGDIFVVNMGFKVDLY